MTIAPGWIIGFLASEDDNVCAYWLLQIVSISNTNGDLEPVVISPDGRLLRASEVGLERAFAAGPHEDARKIAQVHAAGRGRSALCS